jgi:ABC-2 type transport system permease protein
MLWYKSWLETRWRFLIGFAVLAIMACGTIYDYLAVQKLLPLAPAIEPAGELGRRLKEAVEIEREFRGFVWLQWFRQNLTQTGTLFAVLLGSGGLLSRSSGGALFTLSLPVTRRDLLTTRAAVGLAEFFALALVPSLLIPLLAPSIGQAYSIVDALIHALCIFLGGSVFFSLAVLLSTAFDDLWRPLLVACGIGLVLAVVETAAGSAGRVGLFHVMSGESYFRSGAIPWIGMLAATALSAGMLYASTVNIARRDF